MRPNPLSLLRLYFRAKKALQYASKNRGIGTEFAHFGRNMGFRMLLRGIRSGLGYVLTPVNIVRYFEFPFAYDCLPNMPAQCLDVSSPRLFSFYVADKFPLSAIYIINPDEKDITETESIVRKLGTKNIITDCAAADILPNLSKRYDCIWSISVIEHISGSYDDRDAVKFMYDVLRPGGRLILTIPVDRIFHNEYRQQNYYEMPQSQDVDNKYFFQRYYDESAVRERIIAPVGKKPAVMRWFGENSPGRFSDYENLWICDGHICTVNDPKEITDHYREFSDFKEMPGMGVCGLMFQKN